MSSPTHDLFDAFREDHGLLGRRLHELGSALRAGDITAASETALRLDRDAGPHIAFEERHFYPALRLLIGDAVVDRLYLEHGIGRAAVERVLALHAGEALDDAERSSVLDGLHRMQEHVAECGDLFGAMGRIAPSEQTRLLAALLALREEAPRWSELPAAAPKP